MRPHRLDRLALLTQGMALVGLGLTGVACGKEPEPVHINGPFVPGTVTTATATASESATPPPEPARIDAPPTPQPSTSASAAPAATATSTTITTAVPPPLPKFPPRVNAPRQ